MDSNNWQLYLSRPFSLFETSIWDLWYSSGEIEKLLGLALDNGLYIENPKGTVRHYREKDVLESLSTRSAEMIAQDPDKYYQILKDAKEINKEVEKALSENKITNLKEAINFLTRVAQRGTILPYFAGLAIEKENINNEKLNKLVTELRGVSYYPKLLSEVVNPLAIKFLKEKGFEDKEILNTITYKELFSNDFSKISDRLTQRKLGKTFIYKSINGKEEIEWVDDSSDLVNVLEGSREKDVTELRGTSACRGRATGKARIVLSNNIKDVIFDEGDILVSISTNPDLLPLMQKAGAIVTDEGGITSHAAIISRELNIPCVIGTKNATRVLKEGDVVEVDADKGLVKILN